VVRVLTHLINEVICFAETVDKAFVEDWLKCIITPKDG
jgi:hypothetical protein